MSLWDALKTYDDNKFGFLLPSQFKSFLEAIKVTLNEFTPSVDDIIKYLDPLNEGRILHLTAIENKVN
jgi:hypothetical protein